MRIVLPNSGKKGWFGQVDTVEVVRNGFLSKFAK